MQKSLEALVGARSSPFLAQAVSTAGSPIVQTPYIRGGDSLAQRDEG